jgi:hypothetical protein
MSTDNDSTGGSRGGSAVSLVLNMTDSDSSHSGNSNDSENN